MRGPSVTYFGPVMDPTLNGSDKKTTIIVGDLRMDDGQCMITIKLCIIRVHVH